MVLSGHLHIMVGSQADHQRVLLRYNLGFSRLHTQSANLILRSADALPVVHKIFIHHDIWAMGIANIVTTKSEGALNGKIVLLIIPPYGR